MSIYVDAEYQWRQSGMSWTLTGRYTDIKISMLSVKSWKAQIASWDITALDLITLSSMPLSEDELSSKMKSISGETSKPVWARLAGRREQAPSTQYLDELLDEGNPDLEVRLPNSMPPEDGPS